MPTMRMDLAYHGAGFAGWATQPGHRTVQGELEEALQKVLGTPVPLTVAGRTDAGVHAWGQVASFRVAAEPPATLRRALNALTGDDLAVLALTRADDDFDARRAARSRTYCYRLLAAPLQSPFERGLSLFWPYPLYPGLLERCAHALVGAHDFTAFTPTQNEHRHFERTILRAEWKRGRAVGPPGAAGRLEVEGGMELFELWIEADAFLRSMVRALVGTMLEVGSGRRPFEEFEALLRGGTREDAGDTARAHGLYLAAVAY
jgi:tRNA pseudouridine38-40 synthase